MVEELLAARIETSGKSSLKQLLNVAISRNHVWPAFQPIVDLHSRSVIGYEVLARWTDPSEGYISPASFVPLLEKHSLIEALSNHVVSSACRSARNFGRTYSLAFNVSPRQLVSPGFAAKFAKLVVEAGVSPCCVEIEITEGAMMGDLVAALSTLEELRSIGITANIDDFGAGYSNLARLADFPFRKLKIDRQFVHGVHADRKKQRIAAALIGLGQSLGITVVAEGVELEEDHEALKDLGCDQAQGWLYGYPVPASDAFSMEKHPAYFKNNPATIDSSLFQQHLQLKSLYDSAPIGICFLDATLRHSCVNKIFAEEILGLDIGRVKGKTLADLMPDHELDHVLRVFDAASRSTDIVDNSRTINGTVWKFQTTRVDASPGDLVGYSVVATQHVCRAGQR
jgi:EAL domain-containing protein (putative c-di-GMP-specific phosphodiesterase class I)